MPRLDYKMKKMNRHITLLLVLGFFATAVQAQFPVKIKKKDFKKEQEGFKEAWNDIRTGHRYYELGKGAYREARESYLKAYEYNSENAGLNYMIGKCYLYSDNKFESIKYIRDAYQMNPEVNFDIHLMLGMAYHQIHEFENAIEEYKLFQKNLHPKLKEEYQVQVEQLIKQCQYGMELVKEPRRVVINNLGRAINSIHDEYTPVITADRKMLLFTSRRMYDKKSRYSLIDNKYFEDIYFSKDRNGEWSRSLRFDPKVTGKTNLNNVAVLGMSPDQDKIYIYLGKENGGDIYVSHYKKGKWGTPKPMSKFNSKDRELSLCISSDGNTMYFASTGNKENYGGSDIFYSKKNSKGKWEKPKNIGNVINTFQDEIGVSLSDNDSVLYFSSKGHNSMGGYDVFKSQLSDVGLWSKPENLGYPVNTPNNDVFFVELSDKKSAYYASNRESGIGGLDIYEIIFLGEEKQFVMAETNQPIIGLEPPTDGIYFHASQKLKVDTSIIMRGFISDSENKQPVMGKLEIIDQQSNSVIATAMSDSTGNYLIRLPESKKYGVEIVAKGYLLFLDMVDISYKTYDEVVVRNFELDRVEVGAKVILKNIYFESGKSTLKPESHNTLDAVVRLLQNNPTLRLEISGHTDNVGSMKSNIKLSNERAKSCVDYLVSKGISPSRLENKGYGFQFSLFPNTTEEGRAKNRRVEFKVLSK